MSGCACARLLYQYVYCIERDLKIQLVKISGLRQKRAVAEWIAALSLKQRNARSNPGAGGAIFYRLAYEVVMCHIVVWWLLVSRVLVILSGSCVTGHRVTGARVATRASVTR